MTYNSIQKKNNYKKTIDKVVKMWLSSESYYEFILNYDTSGYKLKTLDELSLKTLHFKTEHPVIFVMMNIAWLVMSFFPFIFLLSYSACHPEAKEHVEKVSSFVMTWTISCILAHGLTAINVFCSDIVQTIQWHENGCPIDY